MMQPILIELEAYNPDQNVHRFYIIEILPNLFGLYSLHVRYGRKGTKASSGQQRSYIMDTQEQVMAKVKQILQKRFSSIRRIGVPYSSIYASEAALQLIQALEEQGLFINKEPLPKEDLLPMREPGKTKFLSTKSVDNPQSNTLLPLLNPLPINA